MVGIFALSASERFKDEVTRIGEICNCLAERVGVEPTVPFDTHDFQSCAFGHSATSPIQRGLPFVSDPTFGGPRRVGDSPPPSAPPREPPPTARTSRGELKELRSVDAHVMISRFALLAPESSCQTLISDGVLRQTQMAQQIVAHARSAEGSVRSGT